MPASSVRLDRMTTGRSMPSSRHLLQQLVAADVGQAEIEQDEIGTLDADEFHRRLGVPGLADRVALASQADAQQLADRRFVVDDQNLDARICHVSSSRLGISVGTGILIVKTAPERSVLFAAVIVPPIASTKPRQIDRPSPVPARTWSPLRTR